MSTLLMLTATVLILWLGLVLIFDPDGFRSAGLHRTNGRPSLKP